MNRWLMTCLLLTTAPALARAQENADHAAVVAAIAAFHAALTAGDTLAVTAALGPSFFIADERSDAAVERVRAHLFLAGDRLRAWPGNYLREVGPHRSASVIRSVNVRGRAAVVITRDTGHNGFRSWRDEETTWFLGREDDGWRIVGYVIRDFQLPAG